MDAADELDKAATAEPRTGTAAGIQPSGYLLELSLDWIVLRASENIHHLLSESHVTLIDEPLGRFVHSQALHDLRNLFSRLSATTGVGRAYSVRLTDEHQLVDVAFQLSDGRVLLEAVPSSGCFGEYFGSVGGLIAGLANASGQALLDGGARRMRALTGFDRVTLWCGNERSESSRGQFAGPASLEDGLPTIVCDAAAGSVSLFPREHCETSVADALLRSCDSGALDQLRDQGVSASLRIPFTASGMDGEFRCDCRTPREPSFELHAAAELFSQMFAMRLEMDRSRSPG
jgi:light-regulated signal transduction histidine kinase (bacteriophytochrome)